MSAKPKTVLTADELKQTPEFLACSPKMRVWLLALLENGFDYTAASAAAFNCTFPEKFGYAVRNWPAVRAALAVVFRWSDRDVMLDEIKRDIRRAPVGSDRRVRAQAIYARLRYDLPPEADEHAVPTGKPIPAPTSKAFYVGQLVTHRDSNGVVHTGRVVAVDATGKPKIEDVAS
jgi:hypothetical protein